MTKKEKLRLWLYEESIAQIHGWDFAHIAERSREYPLPWEYRDIIRKYLRPSDKLLDIDTGGGEFLSTLGHPEHLTYATEGYSPNVALCREKYASTMVTFKEMSDYSVMPFDDETFDIVINRHGTYDASELYRILKKGGIFITQQVGENNDRELVEALLPDCEKQFEGHNLSEQSKLFRRCGFEISESDEAYTPYDFYDTGAVVWFAKIIPWEFVGFSVQKCADKLFELDKRISEQGKISTNAHRFYLVAKKTMQ